MVLSSDTAGRGRFEVLTAPPIALGAGVSPPANDASLAEGDFWLKSCCATWTSGGGVAHTGSTRLTKSTLARHAKKITNPLATAGLLIHELDNHGLCNGHRAELHAQLQQCA